MKKSGAKRVRIADVVVLFLSPLIGAWLGLALHITFFASLFVFLGVPSLYLSFRSPRYAAKAVIFSACTVPFIVVLDYVSHLTRAWLVPYSSFPRLFGAVSFEVLAWGFLYVYLAVLFYETFLDRTEHRVTIYSSKLKYYAFAWTGIFFLFLLLFFAFPSWLYVHYWYAKFSVFVAAMALVQFALYPKVFWRIAKTVPYFAYLCTVYEVTALKEGWWLFPGSEFIGWISVFAVGFPLEELIFCFILLEMAVLSYYELVDGDER